jgi:hypothetical protein
MSWVFITLHVTFDLSNSTTFVICRLRYLFENELNSEIIYPAPLILHSAINSRFGDFVDRIYPIGLLMKYSTYLTRHASRIELHLDNGHDENLIGNTLYSRRILFCMVFLHDGNCKVYNNHHWLRRHDRCPVPSTWSVILVCPQEKNEVTEEVIRGRNWERDRQ